MNGKSLPSFGLDQLTALVAEEVVKVKKTMKNPFEQVPIQTINLQAMPVRRIILLGMATQSWPG